MMRLKHRILQKPLLHVAGPSALMMAPLLGLAFHSDQRIMMYWLTGEFGADPFAIIDQNISEIDRFLQQGNFRPLGRFIVYMEQTSMFEIASGTGVAPHVIQGILRLIMVSLLAVVAMYFVLALYRSAESATGTATRIGRTGLTTRLSSSPAILAGFPMVLASTIIVSGALHPVSFFPFYLVLMAIYILLVPLYVCSDAAMTRRGMRAREATLCAGLGMISAMTSEILYLVPVVCLFTALARGTLSRLAPGDIVRSSASSRFVALLAGFLVVFVPSRLAIAVECSRNDCYEGSELALATFSPEQWLGRALAGLQWETLSAALQGDYDNLSAARSPIDLVTNVWLVFIGLALVFLAVTAATRLSRSYGSDDRLAIQDQRKLGVVMCGFGVVLALVSSLMVSLSEGLQGWHERGMGLNQWRDSLLVQLAWAFIFYGLAIVVLSFIGRQQKDRHTGRTLLTAVAAVVVLVVSMNAFLANDSFSIWRRSDSDGSIVNLVSTSSIDFDKSDRGQVIRCELISAYADQNCENCWHSGTRVLEELNQLSRAKYDADYCPVAN